MQNTRDTVWPFVVRAGFGHCKEPLVKGPGAGTGADLLFCIGFEEGGTGLAGSSTALTCESTIGAKPGLQVRELRVIELDDFDPAVDHVLAAMFLALVPRRAEGFAAVRAGGLVDELLAARALSRL